MPTRTVAEFNGGLVRFEVDYDSSDRITALRCINDSDGSFIGEVSRQDSGRSYSKTFLAHTNTYIPIPIGQAQRIQFDGFGQHNQFVGLRFEFKG